MLVHVLLGGFVPPLPPTPHPPKLSNGKLHLLVLNVNLQLFKSYVTSTFQELLEGFSSCLMQIHLQVILQDIFNDVPLKLSKHNTKSQILCCHENMKFYVSCSFHPVFPQFQIGKGSASGPASPSQKSAPIVVPPIILQQMGNTDICAMLFKFGFNISILLKDYAHFRKSV